MMADNLVSTGVTEVRKSGTGRVRHDSVGGEEHVMGGHVEGVLFAIGNPLLDIIAEVTPEFLAKHGLKPEDCILSNTHPSQLFEELTTNFKVTYVPGGATQNSIRIAQWLIGVPRATTFMGCVKRDEIGVILAKKVRDEFVNCVYVYDDTEPTGTCAVCLTDTNRTNVTWSPNQASPRFLSSVSLVAYLGAARHFKSSHLDVPENWAHVEKAHYYYFSGFPLTNCPDALLRVARYATQNDRLVALNLSASYLCRDYKDQMLQLLPHVDILFGNDQEAKAFAEANNWQLTDRKDIALRIAAMPKENGRRGRIIVFTRGPHPTLVIQEGQCKEYPVIPIDQKDIIDLNGAGDAYVGGFLAQLVQGGAIQDCIRSANYAANYIIQQSGCQLPCKPDFSRDSVGF